MRRGACQRLEELKSALVDGALTDADRERVLDHLVGCPRCRDEVAELRRIRAMLTSTRRGSAAPSDLSSRLVSIAGAEATAPLWSRPFRRTTPGALPSRHRSLRIRLTTATAVAGSLLAAAGGLGVAASPSDQLPEISDASGRAQAEFVSVLTQLPLASEPVNAAILASASEVTPPASASDLTSSASASLTSGAASDPSPQRARGTRLGSKQALRSLRRAVEASNVGYRGIKVMRAPRGGSTFAAEVEVAFEPDQGSQVSILSPVGTTMTQRFVKQPMIPRMMDGELFSLLSRNYLFGGATGARVAGRSATMVEAVRNSLSGGAVAARWWVDDQTGLMLWRETYDHSGALTLAIGYSSIWIGDTSDSFLDHLAPSLTVPVTTATLTLSRAETLSTSGWFCSDEIAGLTLVRLRADSGADPDVVHMVYSDGVSTVSVFEERGRLMDAGSDATWDQHLGAFTRSGASSSATWESGETVFTVVTDGSAALLKQAIDLLPHAPVVRPTTMERIHAGWVRIVDHIVG